jgi:transcriptional regulator GlxA family with amidase domain
MARAPSGKGVAVPANGDGVDADLPLTSDDPRIQRVLRYLEAELDRPIRLAELARVAAIERKYFSVVFKRETGWHCFEFVRRRRLKRARSLLDQTRMTVAEVADRVGWDVRTLQRASLKRTGLTPEEYRNRDRATLLVPVADHERVAPDEPRPLETRRRPRRGS